MVPDNGLSMWPDIYTNHVNFLQLGIFIFYTIYSIYFYNWLKISLFYENVVRNTIL